MWAPWGTQPRPPRWSVGNISTLRGRPVLGPRQRDITCQTRTLAAQEPMPQRTLAASSRADHARSTERHHRPAHPRRQLARGAASGPAGSARITPRRHDGVRRALENQIRAQHLRVRARHAEQETGERVGVSRSVTAVPGHSERWGCRGSGLGSTWLRSPSGGRRRGSPSRLECAVPSQPTAPPRPRSRSTGGDRTR